MPIISQILNPKFDLDFTIFIILYLGMIGTDFGKDSSEESKRDSLGSLEDTLL